MSRLGPKTYAEALAKAEARRALQPCIPRTWPRRRRAVKKTADGDTEKNIKLECDDLVRRIIAIRDAKCFTCRCRTGLQVGHLIRRGIEAVRWDLENNHAQCEPCNVRHEEKPEIYEHEFLRRFGGEVLAKLIIRASRRTKLSYIEISAIRDELKLTLARMEAVYGQSQF